MFRDVSPMRHPVRFSEYSEVDDNLFRSSPSISRDSHMHGSTQCLLISSRYQMPEAEAVAGTRSTTVPMICAQDNPLPMRSIQLGVAKFR